MGWFGACHCRPAPGGQNPILDVDASVFMGNICLVAQVDEVFSVGVRALYQPIDDTEKDQSRRSISQQCRLFQGPATAYHHAATKERRYLGVPRTGLDRRHRGGVMPHYCPDGGYHSSGYLSGTAKT
jgi:hypothetical protein